MTPLSLIQSGHRVFVHGAAATPLHLLDRLVDEAPRLKDVSMVHIHIEGPARYADPEYASSFRDVSLFIGHNLRRRIDYDRVDYLPCFLSEVPALFRSGQCALDVALLHVSPPDRFGYCSLGTSIDVAQAAAESARILIAQINPRMPRTLGDGLIHIDEFDAHVDVEHELPEPAPCEPSAEERQIAKHVASLIEDGSTLQLGIGAIPDAVARELTTHKNLGLHSEMWSDGALRLIESGAVTNSEKKVHRGKSVSSFLMGSRRLYDFVDDNPATILLGADYVNNPATILRNPKVIAINSAIEVDLTGQVCADSVGHRLISGVGGQMDFMRGAALSPGGKPIIAMESRTARGESKIVCALKSGAGVVTTRSHVHYVVTEHGIARLQGKTLGERAKALISVAHPADREKLEREWRQTHVAHSSI